VLHKHHPIIHVGADLIQFVYGSNLRMAADLTLDKNLFSQPFSRAFFALVDQFMVKEAEHWRKQSSLAMKAFSEAQKSPAGEAAKYDNCVQAEFDINFKLLTANFCNNCGNSSSKCCLCDPGVNFREMRTFTGHVCVYHVSPPRAHFKKQRFYVIHEHYHVIQAPL